MKNLKYTAVLAFGIFFLASCAATSHVVDDDVYVSKNPQMSSTEEVNNVSSYENYRYRRERGDSDTRYGRDNRMFRTSIFIMGGMGNPMYSPYDPWRYGYAYSPFYDPFNPWNNWGYGNYWGYGAGYGYMPMSFYYNDYYSPWGYSPYGYGYGYGYNNYYNNSPTGGLTANYNTHYGARYSSSGVNNNRRGKSPEAKGLAIQNTGKRNFKAASPGADASGRSRSVTDVKSNGRNSSSSAINSSEVKGSRSVSTGTGLSRNGQHVSSRPNVERGSGTFDANPGRGNTNVRSNTNTRSNNGSFEPRNSGTTRNSGGTTTSPRSNGAAGGSGGTTVRRGGR
ncbi:MAG: hypothetical protein K0R65_261 [Crocinitomicaceae bacterium]|jgi:hypothetical protein|nr:hypothetical protein [Crocinitomicaceae bacterium]